MPVRKSIGACGPVGLWACGPVGLWACGPVGLWACGPVGLWACGLVEFKTVDRMRGDLRREKFKRYKGMLGYLSRCNTLCIVFYSYFPTRPYSQKRISKH